MYGKATQVCVCVCVCIYIEVLYYTGIDNGLNAARLEKGGICGSVGHFMDHDQL